jgi:hypothetical protein
MISSAWESAEDLFSVECYLESMLDSLNSSKARPSIYVLERRHEVDMPNHAPEDAQPLEEGWSDFPPSRNL